MHSGKPLSFEFYLVFNTRLSLSVSRLVDLLEVNSVAVEIQLAFASTMRFLFFFFTGTSQRAWGKWVDNDRSRFASHRSLSFARPDRVIDDILRFDFGGSISRHCDMP